MSILLWHFGVVIRTWSLFFGPVMMDGDDLRHDIIIFMPIITSSCDDGHEDGDEGELSVPICL